jgi:PAS domain S-box-containing protein
MSTSRKLVLGFGVLLGLLLLAIGLNTSWLLGLKREWQDLTTVNEPINAAVYEMEVNVVGIGMNVLQYQETGLPVYRENVQQKTSEFLKQQAEYERLDRSASARAFGKRLGAIFEKYRAGSDDLLDNRDKLHSLFLALAKDSSHFTDRFGEKIIDEAGPDGSRKMQAVRNMRAIISEVTVWLGHYRRTDVPEFKNSLQRQPASFAQELAALRQLALSDKEKVWIEALDAESAQHLARVGDWLALHQAQRASLSEFSALHQQLHDLLQGEIQVQVQRKLEVAKNEVAQTIDWILTTLWLMLGVGLAVGLLSSASVGRWILTSESKTRLAGSALEASETRYRRLFEASRDGVFLLDAETGRITDANPYLAELLEYGRDDLIGKELWEIGLFPDAGASRAAFQDLQARDYIRYEHLCVKSKSGQCWDVEFVCNGYRVNNKKVMQCNVRNITESRRAIETIRRNEERFRLLANVVPSCVWSATASGEVDYANEKWYAYTGLTPEQTTGYAWLEAAHPDDREKCLCAYQKALDEGSQFEVEIRYRGADGAYRWFLNRALPVRDGYGVITSWFGTATDIDDQKRAVEALQEADRRKDEFLAILSHELRNPLAPIRNALHILRPMTLGDPDVTEARAVLDRQFQQLSGIVEDLLDVFRIMHGKIKLRKEALDLGLLVRLAVEDHRSALEMTLQLNLSLPDEPLWIMGDRMRLMQVMSNLLNNAAKYTNVGDRVFVSVGVDDAGKRAAVTVRDTGIGIAPHMVARVFETFTQADHSLDRSRGGLGLGLALVKGLIDLHGGRVQAASEGLGRGAEITFSLALTSAPRMAREAVPAVIPASRPLRILIVEDVIDTARTLRILLMRYGHTISMAHDGAQGVAVAREWHPDVVLCDLGLPVMDGFEVAQNLRADPATSAIRLIALSGYGQEEDRQRSEEAGFDLHLTKPVDPAELQRLLAVLKIGS